MGIFGGMFDPPHIGHLIVASEAAWQLGLDEVRLVVCARPPHRDDGWLSPELRLRLVQAAVAGDPVLTASRAEIDRPGPSYTVDTLERFAQDEPDASLHLVVGADQLQGFERWRRPERILELATLAVAVREGADPSDLEAVATRLSLGNVGWIEMPVVGVSSTMIRERLDAGRPVRHLVPPGVEELLVSEGLFSRRSAVP